MNQNTSDLRTVLNDSVNILSWFIGRLNAELALNMHRKNESWFMDAQTKLMESRELIEKIERLHI